MRRPLIPHPDWPSTAVDAIEIEIGRVAADRLQLVYSVRGRLGDVRWPQATEARRADGLWAHTCFEAFLRPPGGPGYLEFNFAPSGEWAAYAFSAYREGMAEAGPIAAPRIDGSGISGEVRVALDLAQLPALAETDWQVGISAVIESADGSKSYWALAHAPGKADFHHPDCFALELPAPHRA
jgi:hypothetical protein